MIGYSKFIDSFKTVAFKVNKMLKSYTKISKKVSDLLNIKFDSEPVYRDSVKYIKTKIKTYEDRINTIFHDNKMPKQNVSYKCLPVTILDSVIRTNKKYFPKTLAYLMNLIVTLIVNMILNLKSFPRNLSNLLSNLKQ